ncbi:MAG: hypothetical protein K1060chlam2_01357, partial [Chlamydiae bacterium]|nr:hypothetical protein [Chlamydiota bacterium]
MKKCLTIILLACASLTFANEKEMRGQDLCTFTEDVFAMINQEPSDSSGESLHHYKKDSHPEIAEIAEKFLLSFKEESDTQDTLTDAVSALGRLIKCSVDDEYFRVDTAFLLHRADLTKQTTQIEAKLSDRLPQGHVN